jgi:hypothetical protein
MNIVQEIKNLRLNMKVKILELNMERWVRYKPKFDKNEESQKRKDK